MFGRPTSAIADSADWLAVVDRFGIVSERAVLLDALTVVQNLAMPFTLDIEPPPDDVARAGRAAGARGRTAASRSGSGRSRTLDCRRRASASGSARALALDPRVLICSSTPAPACRRDEVAALGADIRAHRAAGAAIALVAVTADEAFAARGRRTGC